MIQQASEFELELMKIIWENGGTALYAEIAGALEKKGLSTTKNTIISLLSRLVDKGYLSTNKIGRRNRYTAIIPAEEYQAAQTESFIDKVYEGNVKNLITTLIREEYLTDKEYEELKKYWEEGGRT